MKNLLEKINNSALKLLMPLKSQEIYKIVVEDAVKLVQGDDGLILLQMSGSLKNVYGSSHMAALVKVRKRGHAYNVFKKQRVDVIHHKEFAKVHSDIEATGVKSVILIPLSYQHKSTGVLAIRSYKRDYFVNNEPSILKLFGSMASLAIKKAQLNSEMEKSLQVRDLFISVAAHELRTPLTTINGYVQLLHSRLSIQNSLESRWVKQLLLESKRLSQLINELLEISRIKAGKLQYVWKECDIKEIVKRSADNFKFKYADRNIIVEDQLNGESGLIVGDFDKLTQVVNSVLENAAKYSSPDTEILAVITSKSRYFCIFITDKGKGIPMQEITKVFEGFYKGEDSSEEGMGLGLYLAKDIVTRHHGRIKIHSVLNKGTTVEIHLPKAKI
ncbi:MAG: GAF domain-containing sensor histidine kinase [Candidatus Levybacteria bacterium]|nr:GAF domain-containing sensor histidine kinase [Candidatus Levybacteria bacterium]